MLLLHVLSISRGLLLQPHFVLGTAGRYTAGSTFPAKGDQK